MKAFKNEEDMKAQNSVDTRVALLEQSIIHINETLSKLDKRLDKFESGVEKRFDKLESEMRDVRKESMVQFRWVMGTIILSFVVPTILKVFHLL